MDEHALGLEGEALFEWLREEAPLYHDEANDLWAVSRYDDVAHVSKNTDVFCSGMGIVPKVPPSVYPNLSMINRDGAEHAMQRGLIGDRFTTAAVAMLEERITEIVDGLLDAGVRDVVRDVAIPLPIKVISSMLGYPPGVEEDIKEYAAVFERIGSGMQHLHQDAIATFTKFLVFHNALIAERQRQPKDDVLSVWVANQGRLDHATVLYEHNLLLVAGAETTRHAISVGIHALLQRPEQLDLLRKEPARIPNAVEEIIRWASPFIRFQRTALAEHTLHGRTLPAGAKVLLLYPAANRDPRAFDDPQRFDVRRTFTKPSVAFGHGKHFCLGAQLARLEIRVLLERLLARFSDIRAAGAAVERPSAFLRGLESLPVEAHA